MESVTENTRSLDVEEDSGFITLLSAPTPKPVSPLDTLLREEEEIQDLLWIEKTGAPLDGDAEFQERVELFQADESDPSGHDDMVALASAEAEAEKAKSSAVGIFVVVNAVCAALHAATKTVGCEPGSPPVFRWIIGGSLPLWCASMKEKRDKDKPTWIPGDSDIWLSSTDPETPLTKSVVRSIVDAVVSSLGWEGVDIASRGEEYNAMNVSGGPMDLQFIECTETSATMDALTTNGTRVLGAAMLDSFDLSCCRVGIMMMTPAVAGAYNSVLGVRHTAYVDMGRVERFHLTGGQGDTRACGFHHDGKCIDRMCENDTLAVPLSCEDDFPREVQRVACGTDDEVRPFLVGRPTVLVALRPCIWVGSMVLPRDYLSYGPKTRGCRVTYSPNPDRYVSTTTWQRMLKYAKRGFVVVWEDILPELEAARLKRFGIAKFDRSTKTSDGVVFSAAAQGFMALLAMGVCGWTLADDPDFTPEFQAERKTIFLANIMREAKDVRPVFTADCTDLDKTRVRNAPFRIRRPAVVRVVLHETKTMDEARRLAGAQEKEEGVLGKTGRDESTKVRVGKKRIKV